MTARTKVIRALSELAEPQNRIRLLKWFGAGLAMMAANTVFLYALVDLMGLGVPVATFVSAEACTLIRFFINHYWVFGKRNPTIASCVQYHVANAGAFTVWWVTANVLTILGMHYLIAGIAAVAFSTLFSVMTNFFWIWSKRRLNE